MDPIARMHTAEHILTAVMRIHYKAPRNLEMHLAPKKTKCDYEPGVPVDEAAIRKIERLVNEEIRKDHPVSAATISRAEAKNFDLWKVPPEAEHISIVRIGALDAQPCSGPHVEHTAQVGAVRIVSFEHRDNGRLRIRFKLEKDEESFAKL